MPRRSLTFVCSKIFATYELQTSIVLHFSRSTLAQKDAAADYRNGSSNLEIAFYEAATAAAAAARGKAELIAARGSSVANRASAARPG